MFASLALAIAGTLGASPAPAASFEPWIGGTPPAFALDRLEGGRLALSGTRGKAVLVHFFASWCEPCRAEVPALDRFASRWRSGGINVLAIAVADADPAVRRFLQRSPVTFPVLLDRDRSVAKAWGVDALPTTIALDATLTPRLVATGDVDWDDPIASEPLASVSAEPHAPSHLHETTTFGRTP